VADFDEDGSGEIDLREWISKISDELKQALQAAVGESGLCVAFEDKLMEKAQAEAAAKIQAVNRGRAARKEAAEQEQAATMIQSIHRGKSARQTQPEQTAAETDTVTATDTSMTDDLGSTPENDAAAAKIQAIQRGKLARQKK